MGSRFIYDLFGGTSCIVALPYLYMRTEHSSQMLMLVANVPAGGCVEHGNHGNRDGRGRTSAAARATPSRPPLD